MAAGLASPPKCGVMRTTPIGKRSSRSSKAVVMILIGMAQEDGVDPAHTALPERRRDDPAARRSGHPGGRSRTDRPGRPASGSEPPGHARPTGTRPRRSAPAA